MQRTDLPVGEVSFVFTDIENSTRLVSTLGSHWVSTLERHFEIITSAFENHDGLVLKTDGDAVFAVFEHAQEAVLAAVDAQRALGSESWDEEAEVKVRIGVHTGLGLLGAADYVGIDVHRASRIADAGHGGQILVSEATAVAAEDSLPPPVALRDLGKFRLKSLDDAEALFQVNAEGLASDFPPLRTLDVVPNNLPQQLTTFFGREEEIETAMDLVERSRVLTLTGPGGTGKTRLALQVAAMLADRFEDGVYFVGLSPVTDPELVPTVILNALSVAVSSGDMAPDQQLAAFMKDKKILLVLDNFEQLLAAAPVVAESAKSSPASRFVVTSRIPLRIAGERELPVSPLPVPTSSDQALGLESETVQLFVDRARSVRPDFALNASNVDQVVSLIEKLDGLPLAIELITSRLRHLPLAMIVERFDRSLLSAGPVDLPDRQRTIDNVIMWSYDLLDDAQRRLFSRLAVFAGGARLEQVEALCIRWDLGIDILDGLSDLVDHSLVSSVEDTAGHRYQMLHVIREFALARLEESGESEPTRSGHLDVYLRLAEEASPHLLHSDRVRWLDVLEADHDNMRAALDWCVETGRIDEARRLAFALWRFWQARGHLHEARRRLEALVSVPGGDEGIQAQALEALGGVYWWRGELEECVTTYEKALEIQKTLGDRSEIANAQYNWALVTLFGVSVDQPAAWAVLDEALATYEDLGDNDGMGNVLWGIGNAEVAREEYALAATYFERAAQAYSRSGNTFGLGWTYFELSLASLRLGNPLAALDHLLRAIEIFEECRDISGVIFASAQMAGAAIQLGDLDRAYRLQGGVEALVETTGAALVGIDFNIVEGLEPETVAALTGADREAFEEGRAMSYEELVEYAKAGAVDQAGLA